MSEANVAVVRAIYEQGALADKAAILAALPSVIPAVFHSDAEWIEAPERVDAKHHHGHDGIRRSFESWLETWDEYRVEIERLEDHGDHVLVVAHESGASRSGVRTDAAIFAVFTFRDGKVTRYLETYQEDTARAALDQA